MKTLGTTYFRQRIFYKDRIVRIVAAIFAAHFIISFGEEENFFELLALYYYYTALVLNTLIAFVMIECIYYFTIHLDNRHPWEVNIYKRSAFQLMGGVIVPLIANCLLAAFYYWCYGTDLITMGHFKYNFPVITLFVLLFNSYYVIHYLFRLKVRRKPRHCGTRLAIDVSDDEFPVLIHIEDKICFEITNLGNRNYLTESLEKMIHQLPADRYFLINRAYIIERSVVGRLIPARSNTIQVKLIDIEYEDVFVSQRNAAAFKEWMGEGE